MYDGRIFGGYKVVEYARLGLSRKAHAGALGLSWRTYRRKEPQGPVEAEPENDQETPTKEGGHNPQKEVFSGVAGTPAAHSSIDPIYAPPDSCGFVPLEAHPGPAAPSTGEGQGRPATMATQGGPRWGQDRPAYPSTGSSLAGLAPALAGGLVVALAPGRQGGAWVA